MTIQQLAEQAAQIVKEYEAGNISADEYKELVANMKLLETINEQTSDLEDNIHYRNVILTAINIATALA